MHRSAYAAAALSVLALVACTVQSSPDDDEETSPTSPAAPAEPQDVAEAGAEAAAQKADASPAADAGPAPTNADAGAKPDAAPGKSTMTVTVSNEKLPLETFTATVNGDAMKLLGEDKKKDREVIVTLPKGVTAGTFPCDATHSISYDDDTDKVLTNKGVQGHQYRPKTGQACSIVVEAAGGPGSALRGKMTGKLSFDYRVVLQNKTDTVDLAGTFSFVHP